MRPGQTDAATDALRAKVLDAARRALAEPASGAGFSIDAVAAKAGVARSVMHQQFGTAAGLMQALLDDIFAHGALAVDLPRAFALADPLRTLAEFIAVFGRVWESERLVLRRLRGFASVDGELTRALAVRDGYRREGLRRLCSHLTQRGVKLAGAPLDPIDVLFALLAFETFDSLAGPERSIVDAVPAVQYLVCAAFGLPRPARA